MKMKNEDINIQMSKTELFKLNKNTCKFQYLNVTRVENRLKGGDGESSENSV